VTKTFQAPGATAFGRRRADDLGDDKHHLGLCWFALEFSELGVQLF
jgi:hypothetical protein